MRTFLFLSLLVYSKRAMMVFPSNPFSPTKELTISTEMTSTTLSIFVAKSRLGFLGLGFGTSMQNGDVFVINFFPSPTISDCILRGYMIPLCGPALKWKLVQISISETGWTAQIDRLLSTFNGMTEGVHSMMFAYSDAATLSFHIGDGSNKMVVPVNLVYKSRLDQANSTANSTNGTNTTNGNSTSPSSNSSSNSTSENQNTTSNNSVSSNNSTNQNSSQTSNLTDYNSTNGTSNLTNPLNSTVNSSNASSNSSNDTSNNDTQKDSKNFTITFWSSDTFKPPEVDSNFNDAACNKSNCKDIYEVLPSSYLKHNYTLNEDVGFELRIVCFFILILSL